jgi:hypothetical protein
VLWDLVIVETQAANSAAAVKGVMGAARKVLACVNPEEHAETINGLLKCLVHFTPDASMLQTMFKLQSPHDEFALAVLSNWVDKSTDAVKNYMLVILQTGSDMSKDVDEILLMLEKLQRRRGGHTVTLLKDEAVLSALRGVVKASEFPTLASFVVLPTLPSTPPPPAPPSPSQQSTPSPLSSTAVPRSRLEDQPPAKKPRLGDAEDN